MKEIMFLILTMILLLDSARAVSMVERRYNALKFGQTAQDYIRYKPNMSPLQNAFSVCSWIRKLYSGSQPHVLSYEGSGMGNEIVISDDGVCNFIFGSNTNLKSKFLVPLGTWYHYCYSWSSSSRTQRVYLDGQLISSRSTSSGRNLRNNGDLVIGNDYGLSSSCVFGGELFKLNFFSKELSSIEVEKMAEDKCTIVEETYGDVRSIKWENILLKTRNGDVTEIETGCLGPIVQQLRATLEQTAGQLNDSLVELERIKQEKEAYETDLELQGQKLNETLRELNQTSKEKEAYETDLELQGQKLNESLRELNQTSKEKEAYETDLELQEQKLNETLRELNQTKTEKEAYETDLDKTAKELNSTTAALNQTQATLEHVRELLEKATNDCPLNTTVTSQWDYLYSKEFFGDIISAEKIAVLRKNLDKLEYFEGIGVTDGMIKFLKLFHDGDDLCVS